ncbi:uncharacterized protein [Palaemon carinicauda]|uniref:uncharacterized protein n=1 Tax=Palaemon carinicauda TaxID=392227 RepID=UPI0035B60486
MKGSGSSHPPPKFDAVLRSFKKKGWGAPRAALHNLWPLVRVRRVPPHKSLRDEGRLSGPSTVPPVPGGPLSIGDEQHHYSSGLYQQTRRYLFAAPIPSSSRDIEMGRASLDTTIVTLHSGQEDYARRQPKQSISDMRSLRLYLKRTAAARPRVSALFISRGRNKWRVIKNTISAWIRKVIAHALNPDPPSCRPRAHAGIYFKLLIGQVSEAFESWQKGNLNAVQVSSIFQSSRSPDFSDILGTFIPSKADIEAYSLSAQDFIQTCSFDRRACSHKQFHTWTSDKYGQCYTFNSAFRKVVHKKKDKNETGNAIPRKTSSIGPMSGIRLTLNINAKDYVSLLSPDVGARIIVHSPHLLPFPEDEGFNISPGLSVSVSISLKKILRVGQPYGKCEDKTSSEIFKEYSAVTCRKVCLEREFWNTCGCFSGQSPVYNDKYHEKPSRQCSPFNVTQRPDLRIFH